MTVTVKQYYLSYILSCRVTEVTANDFCVMDKKTRKAEHHPYGICVWSTGISPRPIASTMMKRFGQGERSVCSQGPNYSINYCYLFILVITSSNSMPTPPFPPKIPMGPTNNILSIDLIILHIASVNSFILFHSNIIDFRRAIATDKFLRVKGADGVFAIGDCSTIEQELMVKKSEELFKKADVNGDGTLTLDEFHKMVDKAKHLYPQVQVQLSYMENNIDK